MHKLILILLLSKTALGQSEPINYYSKIEYEIVDRDTNTITCTNDKYNQSDFKKWDSTYITAHIILYYLPVTINEDSLFRITIDILRKENIQTATLWRDKHALWFIKFSYMSEEMRKQWSSSYIGRLDYIDKEIRLGFDN